MKMTRILILVIIVLSTFFVTNKTSANWYAGGYRWGADGVGAYISTPSEFNIVPGDQSGEDNYVSTYFSDANGTDWLQTGWEYIYNLNSIPNQYVEWCIDCDGFQGICELKDKFAQQSWGLNYYYRVKREGTARWCAYSQGYLRFCVDNLHNTSVVAEVFSEIHVSSLNFLDTTFDVAQYMDPADGVWKDLDNQTTMAADLPYGVSIITPNSKFHTFRANLVFLPLTSK